MSTHTRNGQTGSPRIRTRLSLCPCVSHFPVHEIPHQTRSPRATRSQTLMQTGISGKSRMNTFVPLITFSFRFSTSSADCSCLALNRAPFPLIRIPHSPNASVVPFVEPPIGIGMVPLWRLTHFTLRGASCERCRTKLRGVESDGNRARTCDSSENMQKRDRH